MRATAIGGALLLLLLTAGCGETGTLKVVSKVSSALSADTGKLDVGDKLTLDRVRLSVGELEFESADESNESELGGVVVEVALDGSETQVTADSVGAGTYDIVGVGLSPGVSADFRNPSASILVEGTYDGAAFTWRSTINPEAEFAIDPPVTVPPNGEATVAIRFDVAAWFTSKGSALDPGAGANQSMIEERIMASLEASAVEFEKDGEAD